VSKGVVGGWFEDVRSRQTNRGQLPRGLKVLSEDGRDYRGPAGGRDTGATTQGPAYCPILSPVSVGIPVCLEQSASLQGALKLANTRINDSSGGLRGRGVDRVQKL
jgi:hypothetical protein